MSGARPLTGTDLARAIGNAAALPAVDAAVARRAQEVAADVARAGTTTQVLKRGPSDYIVTVSGEGVFAREFGATSAPATPFIGAAITGAGKP